MMVKPTTSELLEKTDSKFRLVIGTAKRARQISENKENNSKESSVTIAANEIAEGKVEIQNEEN